LLFSELYENVSSMDAIYSEEGSVNSAFIYSEAESDTVAAWKDEFGGGEGYSRREGVYQIDPVITYDYKHNAEGEIVWYPRFGQGKDGSKGFRLLQEQLL